MQRRLLLFTVVLLVLALGLVSVAAAMPTADGGSGGASYAAKNDNRPDKLTTKQGALKQIALDSVLNGNGKAYGRTAEVARGQFVELAREGEDPVWTVLGEFADLQHNQIPEPDRDYDNTTIWESDFSRDYFLNLLFDDSPGANSMRSYYIEQSSNRYTVHGDVTDWVQVSGEAATYDDDKSHPSGGNAVWYFLDESIDGWYQAQLDAGMSPSEIDAYLAQFDVWDRYDWDADGNFNEPDGYIDHAQFVHAGEGNEAGGGILGDDAIWSHSWFAFSNRVGIEGPSPDFLIGGIQIGDSSFWVNKYTIQPENGGVGVFTHEYAHDLGIPDLYDYTGENGTGFWTLMSSGSWLSEPGADDIGSRPNHLGVWEKFQLGWLNYEVAFAGSKSEHKLGPAEYNTKQAQGLFVVLPPKAVTTEIGEAYSGDYFYYSGSGNDLDNFMYKAFTLPAGASLTAMVDFEIEIDWDYAYVVVSTDGGATWSSVETNFSTSTDPNGQNFGYGITGDSAGWQTLTADLSAYEGDVLLGFRYWTDVAAVEKGILIDDIAVTGYPLDDAESDMGWTFEGFSTSSGMESGYYSNYYVVEYRSYKGYDTGLSYAYNFGWATDPEYFNKVEHFPYQDGMLVSYWDNSFVNNNVGSNVAAGRPGGLLLPVDAHPEPVMRPDGGIWRNRVQTYDSTFGLQPTDAMTLHWLGEASPFPSLPAVPVFDDRVSHWYDTNPMGSVIHPNTGTQIRVKSVSALGNFMQIEVRPAK